MMNKKVDQQVMTNWLQVFVHRIATEGEKSFQQWLANLHYRCPEELQEEALAIELHEHSSLWIEAQIVKLEKNKFIVGATNRGY